MLLLFCLQLLRFGKISLSLCLMPKSLVHFATVVIVQSFFGICFYRLGIIGESLSFIPLLFIAYATIVVCTCISGEYL